MDKSKIIQKENVAGRDLAGRDINYYYSHAGKLTLMSVLIERFKKERESDILFNSMIERLQAFCDKADEGDKIIGLEEKLLSGNYANYLAFAQKTKEQFSKKLTKYQFSESAQKILAYLLAEIYSLFNNHVYPLIQTGESQAVVLSAIQDKLIHPVKEMLEENVLEIFSDEINGALYFLTGNCHIKWV